MGNEHKVNVLFDNSGSMKELGRSFLLRNILYTIKDYFKFNIPSLEPKFYLVSEKIVPLIINESEVIFEPCGKIDWREIERFLNSNGNDPDIINLLVSDFSLNEESKIQGRKIPMWVDKKQVITLSVSDFIRDKKHFYSVENIITLLDRIIITKTNKDQPCYISDLDDTQCNKDNGGWE